MVDAAVIAIAERLQLTEIATLDHRHFTVVRPRHTAAFVLLPASDAALQRRHGTAYGANTVTSITSSPKRSRPSPSWPVGSHPSPFQVEVIRTKFSGTAGDAAG
jgi:hypothetical protein